MSDPINKYESERIGNLGRMRNGSPIFYDLLDQMAKIHDSKSHDYASNTNPFANYHFAGRMSKLFDNPDDAGFIGRIGEKIYRLANLENSQSKPLNESITDTENDICVIMTLWVADRRTRRAKQHAASNPPTQTVSTQKMMGSSPSQPIGPTGWAGDD